MARRVLSSGTVVDAAPSPFLGGGQVPKRAGKAWEHETAESLKKNQLIEKLYMWRGVGRKGRQERKRKTRYFHLSFVSLKYRSGGYVGFRGAGRGIRFTGNEERVAPRESLR